MTDTKRAQLMLGLATAAYVFMIVMNTLAIALPLNGMTTAALSDRYNTLFAPTGMTFSIWGLIYLALGADLVQSFIKFKKLGAGPDAKQTFMKHALIAVTSALNGLWIVFWHYELLLLSLIDMVLLFGCLAYGNIILKKAPWHERLSFSIYFGWISVALIANVASYIVSFGVNWNSVGAVLQTFFVIIIAGLAGALTVYLQKDLAYGAVFLWALAGIMIRHLDPAQLDRGYISVYEAAIVAAVFVALGMLAMLFVPKLLKLIKKK